jgi:hypothetical protein
MKIICETMSYIDKRKNLPKIIEDVLEKETQRIIYRAKELKKIAPDIALNRIFKQNLIVSFFCIFSRTPLYICGDSGSSKTLAIKILVEMFQCQQTVPLEISYLNSFPRIIKLEYQGTRYSKTEELKTVFETALDKIKINFIPLILFDEIGLAELSKDKPLKILHEYLEYGKNKQIVPDDMIDHNFFKDKNNHHSLLYTVYRPAFVGISNWDLDISKKNRQVFLARTKLTNDELKETAHSIINYDVVEKGQKNEKHDQNIRFWANQLTETYLEFKEQEKVSWLGCH